MRHLPSLILAGALLPFCSAQAYEVTFTFTNLSGADGVALSPFFIALHDGSYDAFNAGSAASSGIQQLSETGSGAGLASAFAAAYPSGMSAEVTASMNSFGPGIYLPGGSGSITLDLNPTTDRYLSYFAMVVPSNDRFVGNDSPTAIQLFDSSGNFTGGTYTYNGSSIWDAGAVVSQINGAAFLANNGGTSNTAMPGGVIGLNDNFSVYGGQTTAAGYDFSNLPGNSTPLFSLSAVAAVPLPGAVWLFGSILPIFGLMRQRKIPA